MNKLEEPVRQEFIRILTDDYGYHGTEIATEFPIPRGSNPNDKADIAVFGGAGRDPASDVIGIVETKKPGETLGKGQLKSYMTATSAIWGVWTNGSEIEYYCKPKGQSAIYADRLNNIPVRGQRLEDVGRVGRNDLLPYSGALLKASFRRILNTLYANTTISRREKLGNEMIKLIFAKIKDETTYVNSPPLFYAGYGEDPERVKDRIDKLFADVVSEYQVDGLFEVHDRITLDAKSVAWAVGQLERGSLFDTPSDVVGDAFEVFAESKFVGEKGEFFTPRGVIDLAVKLVNPQPNDTVCDPACGSGGFLIATMRNMWDRMASLRRWSGLSAPLMQAERQKMAQRCFFGIDKEVDLVRIAKAYMAISGDGRSNVVHENSLHPASDFGPEPKAKFVQSDGKFRQFDCVMTNPPYGTKTKVTVEDSALFELGHSWTVKNGQWVKGKPRASDPYALFVERCLHLLEDGGRLAIVLPETAFHAPSRKHLRDYITSKGRVLAVIDLPHNAFRPYCNAKTCLLVFEKGAPAQPSHRVVMAEAGQMGHDHRGRELRHPDSGKIWDDLPLIYAELDSPDDPNNEFVFTVPWANIEAAGHLIPRYYVAQRHTPPVPKGRYWVVLGDLVDNGTIGAWDGHGSPSAPAKGQGNIPYIRVKDIVNWELYRDPNSGLNEMTWQEFTRNKPSVDAGDVIYVKRGSYRVGTVAMASHRDEQIVMTRELLTLRVEENELGLTPFYLLALLSSRDVQAQSHALTFYDTTLPNIGNRWRELRLPFHNKVDDMVAMSETVEQAVRGKWAAQDAIERLRRSVGGLVT